MRKSVLFLLSSIFIGILSGCIFPMPPETEWSKLFGGAGYEHNAIIIQTSDGGYIVADSSQSTDISGVTNNGGFDIYLIKLDSDGNVIWQNMYGGSGDEMVTSIQQTNDGGYVVAGSSTSTDISGTDINGTSDAYVIKLGAEGNVVWERMYGGSGGDAITSIQQTTDGGYIAAGNSNSTDISGVTNNGGIDAYLLKFDGLGDIEWQRMFGGTEDENACSVQQTNDGGYIFAGVTFSTDIPGLTNHGESDIYACKMNNQGNFVWHCNYGGSRSDWAYSLQQTSDEGYIIAGISYSTDITGVSNHGSCDLYVIKLNMSGEIVWQKMYGGSDVDYAYSCQQTNDGGYIIAGGTYSTDIAWTAFHGGRNDAYIIKLNSYGNVAWQKLDGGSSNEVATSVQQTNDGGYIVSGFSSSTDIPGTVSNGGCDVYLFKLYPDFIL